MMMMMMTTTTMVMMMMTTTMTMSESITRSFVFQFFFTDFEAVGCEGVD
jgi:hypothetical protein